MAARSSASATLAAAAASAAAAAASAAAAAASSLPLSRVNVASCSASAARAASASARAASASERAAASATSSAAEGAAGGVACAAGGVACAAGNGVACALTAGVEPSCRAFASTSLASRTLVSAPRLSPWSRSAIASARSALARASSLSMCAWLAASAIASAFVRSKIKLAGGETQPPFSEQK